MLLAKKKKGHAAGGASLLGTTVVLAAGSMALAPAVQAQVFDTPVTNPFGLTDVGSVAAPDLVDIDDDGDFDAFVGDYAGNLDFFENTGDATNPAFAAAVANPFGLTDVGQTTRPSFVDIDADGDLDVFVGEVFGDTFFFENTGDATNPAFAAAVTNPFNLMNVGYYAAPDFVDLDGDGDFDGLIGHGFAGEGTTLFRNIGDNTTPLFAAPNENPFGLTSVPNATPAFVDIDGDSDLDAFLGDFDGNTSFFENTGTIVGPAFAAAVTNPFGLTDVGYVAKPAFVDIDADGDLDGFIGQTDGNTIFYENLDADLPVVLAGFQAQVDGQAAVLSWQTHQETNNAGFEVHRLLDGTGAFTMLGFVPGAGSATEQQAYTYRVHGLAPGVHRFRIKQLDFDGTFTYSAEVEVTIEVPGEHLLSPAYPNPFSSSTSFNVHVARAQAVQVQVYDMLGRLVDTLHNGVIEANEPFQVRLDAGTMDPGTYIIRAHGETFQTARAVTLVR